MNRLRRARAATLAVLLSAGVHAQVTQGAPPPAVEPSAPPAAAPTPSSTPAPTPLLVAPPVVPLLTPTPGPIATPPPAPEPTPPPVPRSAELPARVSLSNSLRAAYHLDSGNIAPRGSPAYDPTGTNFYDWLNRLQMDVAWGNLTAQVRVDTTLYASTPMAAESDIRLQQLLLNRYANRLDFEKLFLTYSSRNVDVTLGDVYATYGRGLVLSLRKVDEFGVDNTARGISATGRVAGLTVSGLAGLSNIINVDPASARYAENPDDLILGAHADYRFGKWVTPGFNFSHVVYATNFQTSSGQTDRDSVTSLSGSLDFPHLARFGNLYAELAAQRRVTQGSQLWSSAFYGNASAWLGPVTLLLEAKDYRRYGTIPTSLEPTERAELALTNFYSAAPTLERIQQLVLNNTDVTGVHARASLKLRPDFVPFVSMAAFADRVYQTRIYDPYLGAEILWNNRASRASLSAGYRVNVYDEGTAHPGRVFQDLWHVEYDINQHLTGAYSAELSGLHQSHRDAQGPKYHLWNQGQAYLALKKASAWSVALGYEYYTEAPASIRPHYPSVSGSLTLIQNLMVRWFVGGQRAGIKCVNGVCRNYPAFTGVRVEVVAKY